MGYGIIDEVQGDKDIRDIILKLPKLDQRQYSTSAQIVQLVDVARKLGLYDALNCLNRLLEPLTLERKESL